MTGEVYRVEEFGRAQSKRFTWALADMSSLSGTIPPDVVNSLIKRLEQLK